MSRDGDRPAPENCDLLFIGQFPGPISGQTVMTALLFDHLKRQVQGAAAITPIDIVRGNHTSRLVNFAVKIARSVAAFLQVILTARGKNVYISLNSNVGMLLSLGYVFAARLGGANRQVLHHHSRDHIDRENRVMRAVIALAGPSAVHLCICPKMAQQLQAKYPAIRHTAHLNNVVGLDISADAAPRTADESLWRLGHMSKLSLDKGLGRAIAALELLRARGVPAQLSLAGNFATAADRDFAMAAKARLGAALQIEGLLTGTRKADWFANLDLFVFPSLYRNETQGIVNLEALAAGTPVLAYGGHCIEDDLAGLNGWCIPVTTAFPDAVVARLQGIGRAAWSEQRRLARRQFELLHQRAQADLAAFPAVCLARNMHDIANGVELWPQ